MNTSLLVSAVIELAGAVVCAYMILLNYTNIVSFKEYRSTYKSMVCNCAVCAAAFLCAAITCYLKGDAHKWAPEVLRITIPFEYLLNQGMHIALTFYFLRMVDQPELASLWKKVCGILGLVFVIMIVTNPLTHLAYRFIDSTEYVKSPTFFVILIPALIIQIGSIVIFCKARKQKPEHSLLVAIVLTIVPAGAMALQYFYEDFPFIHAMFLFCVMLVNLYLQQNISREMVERQKKMDDQEISLLVAQLQPHFMYNALLAIMEIDGNPPKTVEALSGFAHYLRGNLNALKDNKVIPISQELRHVKAYVRLEQFRYNDKLNVQFDIQEEKFWVPPLSLEMLVENAIKHGIAPMEEGTVTIRTYCKEDWYIAEVADSGIGIDNGNNKASDPFYKHVGLGNVTERVEKMCDGQVMVSSQPGNGTSVRIMIPKDAAGKPQAEQNGQRGLLRNKGLRKEEGRKR